MRICTHFARTGTCKFGASCRFSHDLTDQNRVTAALDEDRNARGQLCSFFQRTGFCKHGDKCRFLHMREQDLGCASLERDTDPLALFAYTQRALHSDKLPCT